MTESISHLSEIDSSNPFFLHHGDSPGTMIVSKTLNGENYNSGKRAMMMALTAKNKLSFVNGALPKPANLFDSQGLAWTRCNNMVLSWLINSVSTEIANSIIYIDDASEIWNDLQDRFSQHNRPRIFQLQKSISSLTQLDSSDEALKEEEEEVLKLQRERAKKLSVEDFGLKNDEDESDKEQTLGEISNQGKRAKKARLSEDAVDELGTTFGLKKDLNELSRKEQMEIISSSAPELVGLLSELNSTLEELENKVNPLLKKVKVEGTVLESGLRYLQGKQLLLLSYCQTITFYLLLKSEGQPVLDHPVIARLVEIKGLMDKMKQLDENLPSELDEFLKKNPGMQTIENLDREGDGPDLASHTVTKDHELSLLPADAQELAEPHDAIELLKTESLTGGNRKEGKHKRKNDEVGVQSMEMLKVRAALEEKLKQKGAFSSFSSKPDKAQKHPRPVNGRLESHEDYDDDVVDGEKGNRRLSDGHTRSLGSKKLSKLVISKQNKPKVVSGDDDLPTRDDIGERRRKHELRVLADAGIRTEDDAGIESDKNDDMDEDADSSENDLYEQVKQKRAAKLAAKAEIYTRTSAPPSLPETADGKRHITYQIEKNRGLTRPRNKLTKNPRKKYRTKHDKAQKRRLGQVRQIKKPSCPYGGESSGINARISRSIRL